jgi:hypothetical protein
MHGGQCIFGAGGRKPVERLVPGLFTQPTREPFALRRAHSLQGPLAAAGRNLLAVQVLPAIEPDVAEGKPRQFLVGIGEAAQHAADVIAVDVSDHQQVEAALVRGKGGEALPERAAGLLGAQVYEELVAGPPDPDGVALPCGKKLHLEAHGLTMRTARC